MASSQASRIDLGGGSVRPSVRSTTWLPDSLPNEKKDRCRAPGALSGNHSLRHCGRPRFPILPQSCSAWAAAGSDLFFGSGSCRRGSLLFFREIPVDQATDRRQCFYALQGCMSGDSPESASARRCSISSSSERAAPISSSCC